MDLFKAFSLGIVQGLTEFLPISSSGHLVLFQNLFGMKEPMISFDIALHAGTLLAVFIYFRKEMAGILSGFWSSFCPCACAIPTANPMKSLWIPIVLTLVPTGIIAVLFKDKIETAFTNLTTVAGAWLAMGLILVASKKLKEGSITLEKIGWGRALVIGVVQGIALLPGVSRSGSTILGGMLTGLKKEDAARFSFLISIPAILAAIAMDLKDGIGYFNSHMPETLIGFFTSAVTGYAVIKWLMGVIHKGRFHLFGYYCIAIGFLSIGLSKLLH